MGPREGHGSGIVKKTGVESAGGAVAVAGVLTVTEVAGRAAPVGDRPSGCLLLATFQGSVVAALISSEATEFFNGLGVSFALTSLGAVLVGAIYLKRTLSQPSHTGCNLLLRSTRENDIKCPQFSYWSTSVLLISDWAKILGLRCVTSARVETSLLFGKIHPL